MPSFTIPIPEPKDLSQKLARVTWCHKGDLEVFWHAPSRQVVFRATGEFCVDANNEWFVQPDGNIIESLSRFLPCASHRLAVNNIFVFAGKKGKAANAQLCQDIYDCEWSDFACERLVLNMNVEARTQNLQHAVDEDAAEATDAEATDAEATAAEWDWDPRNPKNWLEQEQEQEQELEQDLQHVVDEDEATDDEWDWDPRNPKNWLKQ